MKKLKKSHILVFALCIVSIVFIYEYGGWSGRLRHTKHDLKTTSSFLVSTSKKKSSMIDNNLNQQYLFDLFKARIVRPKYDVNCKNIINNDMACVKIKFINLKFTKFN